MNDEQTPVRVLVWNENFHEQTNPAVAGIYPDGIHEEIARALRDRLPGALVSTATLGDPEAGLSERALAQADVLVFWGHMRHDDLPDDAAERVREHVLRGMGLLALHASARSKPFRLLMGTTCTFRWREGEDRELVWVIDPSHPVVRGLGPMFAVPCHEMYGEYFDIPAPDELVLVSSFSGGEVFRSGCGFRRGSGRIFYLSLGHQEQPIYHQAEVRALLANAVSWLAPNGPRAPRPGSTQAPLGWFEEGR